MQAKKLVLIIIVLIGGGAVLGSYAYGVLAHPGAGEILWGGVPQGIRPLYTACMLLAASGYFAFTYFILFRLDPGDTRLARRFGFGAFNVLYAAILIPSALWMPLTLLAVEGSSPAALWLVKIVLWVVGGASLGLFYALMTIEPRRPGWTYRLAVAGSVFFCIQTVILDAILWVATFRL
jgi:hypothetical protein